MESKQVIQLNCEVFLSHGRGNPLNFSPVHLSLHRMWMTKCTAPKVAHWEDFPSLSRMIPLIEDTTPAAHFLLVTTCQADPS